MKIQAKKTQKILALCTLLLVSLNGNTAFADDPFQICTNGLAIDTMACTKLAEGDQVDCLAKAKKAEAWCRKRVQTQINNKLPTIPVGPVKGYNEGPVIKPILFPSALDE